MYRICQQCGLPGFSHASHCPACKADLSRLPSVEGAHLTGAVIEDRYQLVSFLGEGGMAWVYRGTHADIGASVAIKLLKPVLAENPGLLVRFKKEATAISSVSHPNILSVISSGETASGIHYIVTEYIQGTTLSRLIRSEGKLPLARSLDILRQILSGLEEAHARGIIHRDLKPENIMVIPLRSGDDFCKIVDFGIARQLSVNEERLTRQGEIMGTPEFMAPEIIRGEEACPATDLYAAGIILHEMLTGALPFSGSNIMQILMDHLYREPALVRTREPGLPQEVENLLTLALIKDPARRISSAGEFLQRLHFGPTPRESSCRTCGQTVLSDQRFCSGCGRLQEEGDPERTTYRPAGRPSEEESGGERMFSVPFFNRKRELAALRTFLSGKRVALELSGVPGVGKAALVAHALSLFAPDRPVFTEGPDREGLRRAWRPVVRIITHLAGWSSQPDPEEVLGLCRRMKIEPEEEGHILSLFGLPQEPCALEHRVRRREMITSVARLLLLAAQDRSALLVFLDLDRFDLLSCQVIEQVVRLNRDDRVRVLVTDDRPRLGSTGPLDGVVLRLELSPFDAQTAGAFCAQTQAENGYEPAPGLSQLVVRSGGLPLHLVEGLRLLHEGIGDLDRTLSDLVQMRVRNLPGSARRLLQWISTAGGRLSGQFVRESGFLEKASVDAVLDCVRHGFLTSTTDGQIQLVHPSFSRFILAEMSAVLRTRMQESFFGHLESGSADPRALAASALQSNQMEPAIDLLQQAGALCESLLDDPGALHHFRKAYELAEVGIRSGVGVPRFVTICGRYGDLLRYTGKTAEAERVLREAMLYCRDGEPDTPRILSSLARSTLETAPEHAEGLGRRAMKLALRCDDPRVLFRVCHDYGRILCQRGPGGQGLALLRQGADRLEQLDPDGPELWRLHLQCAACERDLGQVGSAVGTCRRILESPAVARSWLAQARCHEELVKLALVSGEPREAVGHLSRVIAYHRFTGDRVSQIDSQLRLAELDAENRSSWAQGALALALRIGDTEGQQRASRLLGRSSGDLPVG